MPKTRLLAVGLALLSGTAAANAQVISREVSQEPVETLITRGPDGITVTRRPLQTMAPPVVSTVPVFPTYGPSGEAYVQSWAPAAPAWTPGYAAAPGYAPAAPGYGNIDVRPYAPPVVATETTRTVVVEESVDDPVPPPVRTVRRGTPPIMARAVEPEPTRTTRSRTVTRRVATDPIALAPTQRTVIYRTLAQQTSYDPALLERVTPTYAQPYGTTVYSPGYGGYAGQGGYAGYAAVPVAPAVRPVTYTVGTVVPESVTLAPVPRRIVAQVPETRGYGYAVVGGRVLLIEPTTGTVVADITR